MSTQKDGMTESMSFTSRDEACLYDTLKGGDSFDERMRAAAYERYSAMLGGFLLKHFPHEKKRIEEVVMETWEKAFMKIDQFRGESDLYGWLQTIARHHMINCLSRNGGYREKTNAFDTLVYELEGKNPARDKSDVLQALMREEEREQLLLSIGALKPVDRETLLRFYFCGRSILQMAEEFQCPAGTVKRRLFVARARLKEILEKAPAQEAGSTRRSGIKG